MTTPTFTSGPDTYTVAGPGDYDLDFLGGDDSLTVNGGTTTTAAMGTGNDYVRLLAGAATVYGDEGSDRFDIYASGVTAWGGADNDLFIVRGGHGQTINGEDGNDRINIAANVTDLTADLGAGADVVNGYGFDVSGEIFGGDGNDTFVDLTSTGGLILQGGMGNDTYRVSGTSFGATISEFGDFGIDTVQLARGMNYVLPMGVENLVVGSYAGSTAGPATIVANDLYNALTGSGNAETMFGLGGNDHLNGKAGDDILSGGAGNDVLDGGLGNDTLLGDDGIDILIGRDGADTMAGGAGNDTYYVDNVGDVVVESSDGGVDSVRTTVDWTLSAWVENGAITSSAGLTLTGNDLDNHLFGGAGDDVISGGNGINNIRGGAGNDILDSGYVILGEDGNDVLTNGLIMDGGAGNDWLEATPGQQQLDGPGMQQLTGGTGNDTFAFSWTYLSNSGATTWIRDFTSAAGEGSDDQIDLSGIDANVNLAGDQAFIDAGGDTPTANGIWYYSGTYADGSSNWVFLADVDGDANPDFEFQVNSAGSIIHMDDLTL
jgi:Ca2+-binding RTX toxin-like protein